jgi:transcriptional regulator with XRE-family HTH domain
MDDLLRLLGQRIRRIRTERGYASQEAFADYLGVHRTFMGHLETGRKDFRLTTLIRVANALGVTLSALFSGLEQGADSAPTTHKSMRGNQSLDRSKVLREVAILEQTVRNLRTLATEEEKSEKRVAATKRRAKSKRAKE